MKRIKDFFIKNKLNCFIFLGMVIFSYIVCINFIRPHFSQDAYFVSGDGYRSYAKQYLNSNRMFSAAILLIADKLKLPLGVEITIMSAILVMVNAISWFLLYKFIIKLLKKEKSIIYNILIGASAFLVVFNISTAEGLLFAEVGTMPIGVLFAILGAILLVSDNKFKYLTSALCVIISGLMYQATTAIFVPLVLVFIFIKYEGNLKEIVKQIIIAGIMYCVAMIINFIGVKVWSKILDWNFRSFYFPGLSDIWQNTLKWVKNEVVYNVGLTPKYWYLSEIIFCLVIFISQIIKEKKKYFRIFEFIFITLLAILVPLIPILMMPVKLQYMEPRMVMSFGSIIGILLIYLYGRFDFSKTTHEQEKNNIMLTTKEQGKYNIMFKILGTFSILAFVGMAMYFSVASAQMLAVNQTDKTEAKLILEEIKKYENETGITVKYIGVVPDKNVTSYLEGAPILRCLNIRSMGTDWSVREMLNTYGYERYEDAKIPENVREEFMQKDWNQYSKEQLLFDGENLFVCIY